MSIIPEIRARVYRGHQLRVERKDYGTGSYDQTRATAYPVPHGAVVASGEWVYRGDLEEVLQWLEAEVDRHLARETP